MLVLHPSFEHVAGGRLVADGRYVFISGGSIPAGEGVLIDGRTLRRRTVSTPGCGASAIGGPWIVFVCGFGTDQTFELYSIQKRNFKPFSTSVEAGPCPTCVIPVAVGSDWIALNAPPGDHGYPTFWFENIASGKLRSDPTSAETNVDLNSPGLVAKVCRPLHVPTVSDGYASGWGDLVLDGRLAIAAGSGGAYLERCGTHQHKFLTFTVPGSGDADPGCAHLDCVPTHDRQAIVWQSAAAHLTGIFLPDEQQFEIRVPRNVDSQTGFANGDKYQLALTGTRLYLVTPRSQIWSIPAPTPRSAERRRSVRVIVVHPHVRKLPLRVFSYPQVSGHFGLFTLDTPNWGKYVLFDDRNGSIRRIDPPSGCGLWNDAGNAFGVPWALFYCSRGPELYNVLTRRWRVFPCGAACEDTGVAAPAAVGRFWVDINEVAFCDERYSSCSPNDAFVHIPDGRPGRYVPKRSTVLDLNSPSLSQKVCRTLQVSAPETLSGIYGKFGVVQDQTSGYLGKCGSRLHLQLISPTPQQSVRFLGGNDHFVLTCDSNSGRYNGIYLPSLRRFTFSLPAVFPQCGVQLGAQALYPALAPQDDKAWIATIPTAPASKSRESTTHPR